MSLLRALYSVFFIAIFSVGAMFVITKYSDAQETSCPAGTVLSADGASCLSEAVNDNVTTTTSCTQGVLSADGQSCVVPRLDTQPAPADTPLAAPVPIFTG